ncbi:MAG TPA: isochorismatase family protein [Bryobacteraceae bacterium]|nr:isochorismatase family protein [Bryobacteraceae bacterium]
MQPIDRRSFLRSIPGALLVAAAQPAPADLLPNRPKVPGTLSLGARRRTKGAGPSEQVLHWPVARTAIIICDMWDTHTCAMSAQRVALMAPRMNQVVSAARSLGVMIIHSPSDTMKYYEGTPWRERMRNAPKAASPFPIIARCPRVPEEERDFPIDDSAGGCDDPVVKSFEGPPYPWTREHPAIDIVGFDGVSESGQEIYNFCKQEGIDKIVLMGVHTNICILNRGFGARQMTRLGFEVVLARDLTDAMYDPRTRPFVSHARGTELVIEHIETMWCPSILSEDLTRVVPGSADPAPGHKLGSAAKS